MVLVPAPIMRSSKVSAVDPIGVQCNRYCNGSADIPEGTNEDVGYDGF